MDMAAADRICVGVISGVHGVRGIVKVRPFTADPADVAAYGPLTDKAGGRVFALRLLSMHKGQWLARLDGVEDRDAAEAVRGTELFADRDRMPAPEPDEFYHTDLIGLAAMGADGEAIGTVRAVHDFGAGDILEIVCPKGPALMLPFTLQAVPEIDLAGGRLVVDPPAYMADDDEAGEPDGEAE
jgi:16S rRNA processing protein RimM